MSIFWQRVDAALFRRYWVIYSDPTYPGLERKVSKRFTFGSARRLALRERGTRIYQPAAWSFVSIDRGWSETRNGYRIEGE